MLTGQVTNTCIESLDLSNIPREYWEFMDIFCKHRAKTLPSHRSYDLSIQIKEGSLPPLGPIYSLSALELQTLREFIEENTKVGTI